MSTGRMRITGLCHTAVCILTGVLLAVLLGANGTASVTVPPAMDAAAQRMRLQEELGRLNGKMDELIDLLKSGNVKVVCVRADNGDGGLNDADGLSNRGIAPAGATTCPGGVAR